MATHSAKTTRILRIKPGDDIKTIYAKARKAFTAADLQRYTEEEEMFPAEQLARKLDELARQAAGKTRKKKK